MVFNARPGELFVIRNVANIVPPYGPDAQPHGVSSAIEFAVRSLKVREIVVEAADCKAVPVRTCLGDLVEFQGAPAQFAFDDADEVEDGLVGDRVGTGVGAVDDR